MHRGSALVVPHPHRRFAHWYAREPGKELPIMPYCLSHNPTAGCFIAHYNSDTDEKRSVVARALDLRRSLLDDRATPEAIRKVAEAGPQATPLPMTKRWYCEEAKGLTGLEQVNRSRWLGLKNSAEEINRFRKNPIFS